VLDPNGLAQLPRYGGAKQTSGVAPSDGPPIHRDGNSFQRYPRIGFRRKLEDHNAPCRSGFGTCGGTHRPQKQSQAPA
jgi:hypothetical protein